MNRSNNMNEENKISIQGYTEFLGKQVPNIYGGFGKDNKCILASDIAKIHEVETKEINKLINNNLDEFEENIDIIDLKADNNLEVIAKNLGFITSNGQKYCYLLSEQGYIALVGLMKTKKAREIRKQFRRDYFRMNQTIEEYKNNNDNKLINLQSQQLLSGLDDKISKLDNYYKPSHKKKLDINKYIKECLGTLSSRENCDRVKSILLTQLGYEIYDDVPINILHSKNTYEKIFDICKLVQSNYGQVQTTLFDD